MAARVGRLATHDACQHTYQRNAYSYTKLLITAAMLLIRDLSTLSQLVQTVETVSSPYSVYCVLLFFFCLLYISVSCLYLPCIFGE